MPLASAIASMVQNTFVVSESVSQMVLVMMLEKSLA
jgi:hypothetical protein